MNGSIRQRSPGSWEIKYDLGRDPLTGRRIIKFATVRGTKRAAQQELRRRLAAVEGGMHADPGKLTVGEWLLRWLEEARQNVAPKTHERYREIVEKHLVPALGHTRLRQLQPLHLQGLYTKLLASGRRDGRGGLSPQTVIHIDRVLHIALKRARQLRLIAVNPADDVKRPKVERREIRVLDAEESARLLKAARDTRLYTLVFLALATGMRRGELLGLRWQDVDLDKGALTVAQSLEQTRNGLRFKPPKTRRSRRTIALSPTMVAALRAHKVEQLEERFALGLGKDEAGLVFTRGDGGLIQPDSVTKIFARIVRQAGIKPVSLHGLRHTHITSLLRAGVHPKIASERAGHASVAMTMDVYSHAITGLQEDAALRIDGALRQILEE